MFPSRLLKVTSTSRATSSCHQRQDELIHVRARLRNLSGAAADTLSDLYHQTSGLERRVINRATRCEQRTTLAARSRAYSRPQSLSRCSSIGLPGAVVFTEFTDHQRAAVLKRRPNREGCRSTKEFLTGCSVRYVAESSSSLPQRGVHCLGDGPVKATGGVWDRGGSTYARHGTLRTSRFSRNPRRIHAAARIAA